MGILTNAMMRLRDEIVSSRHSRLAFRGELVQQTAERRSQVSALCTAFARDRAGAHRAWFGRTPTQREVVEREKQRRLAEEARAEAPAQQQPRATSKAEPQTYEPAKHVPAPAAQAHRPPFKGSKKH